MTGRDRIVMIVIAVLAVAAGGWMLVVSPKRKEVKTYEEQVATAETQLSTAKSQLANAKAAQSQYATAYASVVRLGKAVPPSQEVASLVYELEQASNQHAVSFDSIATSSAGGSPSASAAATAATGGATGFTQMPFTFVFAGGFFDFEHLFRGLTAFTSHGGDGSLQVSGRLLTIQSVKLAPEAATPGAGGGKGAPNLTGTVTATAYVLPAGQGVTAGATPSSPSGTTAPAASAAAGSTTTPAVARVTP
ncbi:MAG TPA: type II secretion system protein GspM [Solirubrobacteraceae bacterium]|nr:type II secretion system protein GspM [Solirubrobacteraceae bacterium]